MQQYIFNKELEKQLEERGITKDIMEEILSEILVDEMKSAGLFETDNAKIIELIENSEIFKKYKSDEKL